MKTGLDFMESLIEEKEYQEFFKKLQSQLDFKIGAIQQRKIEKIKNSYLRLTIAFLNDVYSGEDPRFDKSSLYRTKDIFPNDVNVVLMPNDSIVLHFYPKNLSHK